MTKYFFTGGKLWKFLWKFRKFSLTETIFREINSVVTYLVKLLLSRKFCQKSVKENFRNFHIVHHSSVEITGILSRAFLKKKSVKVTVLLNKLLKSYLTKKMFGEREFIVFPQCVHILCVRCAEKL